MPVFRNASQAFVGSLTSHRIALYSIVSVLAVLGAVANALRNHSNFYSVAVYLSRSSRSLLIFANFGLLFFIIVGQVIQAIFFGELRAIEVERLHDRAWYFVTESLLAFTIFRDEFDVGFVLMFGFLLFVKSFHWLASDRIEWMDQRPYPGPPLLFHFRMISLFVILWTVDFVMFLVAIESTLYSGVSGMVLFASEYGILIASVWNTIAKYLLTAYELRRAGQRGGETAPPWENKSMWIFYIELATDFLKLTTYMVFFLIIMAFYGLPLNIVRDVFLTGKSFWNRLRALQRYQAATRNMDQRYPNATAEELAALSDHTCIICREEMVGRAPEAEQGEQPSSDGPNMTPKKLPCGHIFHFYCLKSWLERQQSCPTCRRSVLEPNNARPNGEIANQNQDQRRAGLLAALGVHVPPNGPLQGQDGNAARLLNLAGQPPLVPGQFAHGPFQGQRGGENPAVVIQYHIHNGEIRPVQGVQPAPVHLQPAPAFQGFVGPGGAWQQWPAAENANRLPANLPNTPQTESRPQPPTPSRTSDALPTTPASHPQPADHEPSSELSTSGAEQPNEPIPSNPREAAALAALRRFSSNNSGHNTQIRIPPSPSPSTANTRSQNSSNATGVSPTGVSDPTTSTPTPAASPKPNAAPSNTSVKVPNLIPLYDYGHSGSRVPSPLSFHPQPYPSRSLPQNPATSSLPNYPSGHATQTRPPLQRQAPSGLGRTLSQLPPTLTESQLTVLDSLTREAIDERLRILEGVSGTIDRCVRELMRLRSALPVTATSSGQPAGPDQSPAASSSVPRQEETVGLKEDSRTSQENAGDRKAEEGTPAE